MVGPLLVLIAVGPLSGCRQEHYYNFVGVFVGGGSVHNIPFAFAVVVLKHKTVDLAAHNPALVMEQLQRELCNLPADVVVGTA